MRETIVTWCLIVPPFAGKGFFSFSTSGNQSIFWAASLLDLVLAIPEYATQASLICLVTSIMLAARQLHVVIRT